MRPTARWVVGWRAVAAVFVLAGCSTSVGAAGISGRHITALPRPALEGTVAGLDVKPEDVAPTVRQFRNSYADAVSVYSQRVKGVLEATLQVSRFRDADRLGDPAFRRGLIDQVASGTRAQVIRVDERDVHVTRGVGQRVFVWFDGRHVLVLSVRDSYRSHYGLLRAVTAQVKT